MSVCEFHLLPVIIRNNLSTEDVLTVAHDIYIYIYIYIFIRHEDRKKEKTQEQLNITKRIQYNMIMHLQKQHYIRHFD